MNWHSTMSRHSEMLTLTQSKYRWGCRKLRKGLCHYCRCQRAVILKRSVTVKWPWTTACLQKITKGMLLVWWHSSVRLGWSWLDLEVGRQTAELGIASPVPDCCLVSSPHDRIWHSILSYSGLTQVVDLCTRTPWFLDEIVPPDSEDPSPTCHVKGFNVSDKHCPCFGCM